jgi:upstream activation factor subunit UAF30
MPRKANPKTESTESTESVVTPTVKPAAKPVAKSVVKSATKNKSAKVKKDIPDTEEIDDGVSDIESTVESKSRRQFTRESVIETFDELISSIEEEISRLRETPQIKTKGVKFLRSLGKNIKVLRGQTVRVMKQRVRTNRKNNTNSGFLKPVKISKDMAKFTGWDPEVPRSRVDVTKYVCNYIRENNLQNPTDRRQILADSKLSKLLKVDPKNSEEPLTYYRIQTHLKPHFLKCDSNSSSA